LVLRRAFDSLIRSVPRHEKIIVLGDFNARLGTDFTKLVKGYSAEMESEIAKIMAHSSWRHAWSMT